MTLNNQLFINKNRVSAVQFTGTVTNSAEIIEWLRDRNEPASTTSTTNTQIVKGKTIRTTVKTLITAYGPLPQNSWIVEEGDDRLVFFTEESFLQNFAPVDHNTPV